MHFQPGWWNRSLSSEEEEEQGSVWCPSTALWQWAMMMDVENKRHFTTVCPYSPSREEFPGVPGSVRSFWNQSASHSVDWDVTFTKFCRGIF